jgi:small subunit ribosomal protein S2
VTREAERCGMYYVNNRWLGGTLTNWQTIRQSIRNLKNLEDMDSSGAMEEMFKKKEAIRQRKRASKLNENLCGIKDMARVPDVMFVIDAKKEAIAIREAERLGIPCIAVVDTNSDPDVVPIPVPGNDDAIRAIQLFCSIIADAVLEGRMRADKVISEKGTERRTVVAARPDVEPQAETTDEDEKIEAAEEAYEAEAEEAEER